MNFSRLVAIGGCIALFGWLLAQHWHRSLWLDEAWVVECALEPGVIDTWNATLRKGLTGPAGYMAAMHGLSGVAGSEVGVYRLPSLASAVALAAAVVVLTRRFGLLESVSVLAVLCLFASPLSQRYAFEVKPYLWEAALSVWLLALATSDAEDQRHDRNLWFVVALVSVVSLFAAWFAVAATAGVWMVCDWRRSGISGARAHAWQYGLLGVTAAGVFILYNRHLASAPALHDYWTTHFLTPGWSLPLQGFEVVRRLLAESWGPYPSLPVTALAVAALLGLATWCVRAPRSGIAASLLVLMPLAASAAGAWPLPARTNLTMVVVLHLGFIYLIATLVAVSPRMLPRRPSATVVTGLATLAIPVAVLFVIREAAHNDPEVAAVTPLLRQLEARSSAADAVVLDGAAFVSHLVVRPTIRGRIVRGPWTYREPGEMSGAVRAAFTGCRVWFTVSHSHTRAGALIRSARDDLTLTGIQSQLEWQGKNVGLYSATRCNE